MQTHRCPLGICRNCAGSQTAAKMYYAKEEHRHLTSAGIYPSGGRRKSPLSSREKELFYLLRQSLLEEVLPDRADGR